MRRRKIRCSCGHWVGENGEPVDGKEQTEQTKVSLLTCRECMPQEEKIRRGMASAGWGNEVLSVQKIMKRIRELEKAHE
jgi:hypothetical protein